MKRELYDEILTTSKENELAGVLRVAAFDTDISAKDFTRLTAHVIAIKEKCEEIGK